MSKDALVGANRKRAYVGKGGDFSGTASMPNVSEICLISLGLKRGSTTAPLSLAKTRLPYAVFLVSIMVMLPLKTAFMRSSSSPRMELGSSMPLLFAQANAPMRTEPLMVV